MRVFALAILVMTACGDDKPECSRSDRSGTYLLEYREYADGTCGPISDSVVQTGGGGSGPGQCNVTYENWSSDDCELETTVVCNDPSLNAVGTFVSKTRQSDDNADVIDGITTLTARDADTGALLCVSTYDVLLTRQ